MHSCLRPTVARARGGLLGLYVLGYLSTGTAYALFKVDELARHQKSVMEDYAVIDQALATLHARPADGSSPPVPPATDGVGQELVAMR